MTSVVPYKGNNVLKSAIYDQKYQKRYFDININLNFNID